MQRDFEDVSRLSQEQIVFRRGAELGGDPATQRFVICGECGWPNDKPRLQKRCQRQGAEHDLVWESNE